MTVHVKGLVLKSRIDYVREFFGHDAWDRVLAVLPPGTRAALQDGVLASSWYPIPLYVEMLSAIDLTFGKGDLALCRDMGRYSARSALSGVYQCSNRGKDVGFANRTAPMIWKQYYDSGKMTTESGGRGRAIVRVRGFAEPHAALCLGTLGWLEGANRVWGIEGVKVEEVTCQARGQECCSFIVTGINPRKG
jgi:hypothetical protein